MHTHKHSNDAHHRWRRIGDVVRIASIISIVLAVLWYGIPEILAFAVVSAGLIGLRLARLAGPFDAAFGATILLATWSGVAGLYEAITWWDILVHFITAGSSAAVLYLLLASTEVTPGSPVGKALPSRSIVVLTFAFGITVAVLWEFAEWAGNAFISKGIHVGYIDTLIDIAVGGAGAIIAGIFLSMWKDQTSTIQSSARQ
ncbi:hypothetical protein GCM10009784_25520 [Arthrobacter parietis]|uniref:DUF2238 domain-containing protein n=2 Tax=Arthrobacter TaxID=1663 RepID=A0ABT6CUE7_9MICC|nr:hypothetical protein [Arthrobacter vasquezii]MDF9277699.1 hypothetical protein [Arthrobacter vasquezii]